MIKNKFSIHSLDKYNLNKAKQISFQQKTIKNDKINQQVMNFYLPKNIAKQLYLIKYRQRSQKKSQLQKFKNDQVFSQDNHKIFTQRSRRAVNLGYKMMMKKMKKSKVDQAQALNAKNRKNKKIQPIQPNSFIVTKKIKPKLQIQQYKEYLLNQENQRYNLSTSIDWKIKTNYGRMIITQRPSSDLTFYKSVPSHFVEKKKKEEKIIQDLMSKINKNPQLFEKIEPWDKGNQLQDFNY